MKVINEANSFVQVIVLYHECQSENEAKKMAKELLNER